MSTPMLAVDARRLAIDQGYTGPELAAMAQRCRERQPGCGCRCKLVDGHRGDHLARTSFPRAR